MNVPEIFAGPDGLFRLGDGLAEVIGLAVAAEVRRKVKCETSPAERQAWAEQFNAVVQPRYGEGYTIQELAIFDASVRDFIDEMARQHQQTVQSGAPQLSGDREAC